MIYLKFLMKNYTITNIQEAREGKDLSNVFYLKLLKSAVFMKYDKSEEVSILVIKLLIINF